MLPGEGVLGVAAVRGAQLVEGGYAVAGLEFEDEGADGGDDAGDVVAFVGCGVEEGGEFPVFGVGARDDYFDEEFVVFGSGDRGVDDLDFGPWEGLVVVFRGWEVG